MMLQKFTALLRKPKWRFGAYSALVMALLIAIGVLVNVGVENLETTYGWRLDFSFNGYTATGEETEAALATLTEPITLYLLYQSSDLDSQLYEVLLRYQRLSDLISVKTVDLAKNPGIYLAVRGRPAVLRHRRYCGRQLRNHGAACDSQLRGFHHTGL